MTDIFGYDVRWLAVASLLLFGGVVVCFYRQALSVYSRKRLLEDLPPDDLEGVEAVLADEEELAASLRSLDHCIRVLLTLSLAFGRVLVHAETWKGASFGWALLQSLGLAGELLILFVAFLEVLPGVLGRLRPELTLRRHLGMIVRIHSLFAPIRRLTTGAVRRAVQLFGGKSQRTAADIVEEEILNAAEEGEKEGILRSRDIDMIESIISYGSVEVSEVMTPRTKMACIDLDDPMEVNLLRVVECGHSRIPAFRGTKDNVLGILYVKDLLRFWDSRGEVRQEDLLRKPHFVNLHKKIGELLQEFKTQRFHIAIVKDDHGGTAGLITIEDIIEEIVGEITDEHDKIERPPLRRLGVGLAEVDGSLHIDELNEALDLDIPEGETYDTIAGFVASQMGKIPSVGEAFSFEGVRFEVTASDERRIRRLRVSHAAGGAEDPLAPSDTVDSRG